MDMKLKLKMINNCTLTYGSVVLCICLLFIPLFFPVDSHRAIRTSVGIYASGYLIYSLGKIIVGYLGDKYNLKQDRLLVVSRFGELFLSLIVLLIRDLAKRLGTDRLMAWSKFLIPLFPFQKVEDELKFLRKEFLSLASVILICAF